MLLGANISLGASAVVVEVVVGSADSIDAVATFETEEIVALGWRSEFRDAREIEQPENSPSSA